MKNYIFLLLATTILFLSCEKNTVLERDSIMTGKVLLERIHALKSEPDQKLSYSLLTQEERFSVWRNKLQSDLGSDTYTEDQKSFIKELRDHLTLDIFGNGSQKDVFHLFWLPKWLERSEKVFSTAEQYAIVFTINVSNLQKQEKGISTSNFMEACNCAVGALFTCYRPQPDYGNWGDCTKSLTVVCAASSHGCGALWDNECDGNQCSNRNQTPGA